MLRLANCGFDHASTLVGPQKAIVVIVANYRLQQTARRASTILALVACLVAELALIGVWVLAVTCRVSTMAAVDTEQLAHTKVRCRILVWAVAFDMIVRVADGTPRLIAGVSRNIVLRYETIVLPRRLLAFLLVVIITTVVGVRVGIGIVLGLLPALFCGVVIHLAMATVLTSVVLLTTFIILPTIVLFTTVAILATMVILRAIFLKVSSLATLEACSGACWDTIVSVYIHSIIVVLPGLAPLMSPTAVFCHIISVCKSRPLSRFVKSRMRCWICPADAEKRNTKERGKAVKMMQC